jgi:hypothetical protein
VFGPLQPSVVTPTLGAETIYRWEVDFTVRYVEEFQDNPTAGRFRHTVDILHWSMTARLFLVLIHVVEWTKHAIEIVGYTIRSGYSV